MSTNQAIIPACKWTDGGLWRAGAILCQRTEQGAWLLRAEDFRTWEEKNT